MIIPFSGTILFLHYEKGKAKRQFAELLQKKKTHEIVHLTFSEKEVEHSLRWEHDKEFEFKGEMYDILSTEKKNDSITYSCYKDKKETSINKTIVKFIAGFFHHNPLHEQQLSVIADFAKKLGPVTTEIIPCITASTFLQCSKDYVEELLLFPKIPPIPPPKYS